MRDILYNTAFSIEFKRNKSLKKKATTTVTKNFWQKKLLLQQSLAFQFGSKYFQYNCRS